VNLRSGGGVSPTTESWDECTAGASPVINDGLSLFDAIARRQGNGVVAKSDEPGTPLICEIAPQPLERHE